MRPMLERAPWMNRVLACLTLVMCAAQAACASQTKDAHVTAMRVLIVGNSVVYVNNLPEALHALGIEQPIPVRIEVDMFVHGGASLTEHAADPAVIDAIATGAFDAVVLQERGGDVMCLNFPEDRGSDSCQALLKAHLRLAEVARRAGSRVFYLGTYQIRPEINDILVKSERMVSRKMRARYVDIGDDWQRLRSAMPDAAWLHADGGHPGFATTVLMAVNIYREMFDADPAAVDVCFDGARYTPHSGAQGLVRHGDDVDATHQCLMNAEAVARILQAAPRDQSH